MEDESFSDNPSMAFRWARRFERACCMTAKYFPLAFVYGLTSWACWVVVSIGSQSDGTRWIGSTSSFFGVLLYLLLNWSYTTAVFTDPGSTTNNDGYGLLPTSGNQHRTATSFTVKSNGEIRFCKKCQARKPDRTHHCSTCRRCVLKMDHHCPWLASCIGLRNYKPFLLFLIYTTIFSFYCFAVSGTWFWTEVMDDNKYLDTLLPINFIMLAVMSGIIGLVVGAFTTWHIMLACRNQTTIECLEKTRYLSTVKRTLHQAQGLANGIPQARQFVDFHATALPGITTREEGEERRSQEPTMPRAHMSYEELERYQSRKRYEEYLDEQDSEKLPNAFDLGWKRNLLHLLGPSPLLWFFPICNTTGDGWNWEPNPKWVAERERLKNAREEQRQREVNAGWGYGGDIPSPTADVTGNYHGRGPLNGVNGGARRAPSKADRILGRDPNLYADGSQDVPMRRLSPRGHAASSPDDDLLETDEEEQSHSNRHGSQTAASRREAERVAMSVVTNTRPWGRGGASGMLRQGSQHSAGSGSGNNSRVVSPSSEVNDDDVD